MRIVIDMQGAQTLGSRNRGIGRYSIALTQAIIRNCGEHEVHLALNGAFKDTLRPIRAAFDGVLPAENIHVWEPLVPTFQADPQNQNRRLASEAYRELFLSQLDPDVIHITSLFEGFGDDAICSIGNLHRHIPTTVTLYDLIPLIHRKPYLENHSFEKWYLDRIDHLRRADMCLAISESSRMEGIKHLGFGPHECVNVGTAADPQFHKSQIGKNQEEKIRKLYNLTKPFLLYTGGIDHRKNVEGLIRSFAILPEDIRRTHQIAIVCSIQDADRTRLMKLARKHGIAKNEMIITGYVPEEDLIALYNLCKLFVFPSWHEGFGLPALEAMLCGAPVIAANRTSLPEVIGLDDALFDPFDDQSIADVTARGLQDEKFRARLLRNGAQQGLKFSWDDCGVRAVAAFERLSRKSLAPPVHVFRPKLAYVSPLPAAKTGIADYSAELLPELSRHYDIDIIVKSEAIQDVSYPLAGHSIGLITSEYFQKNWKYYDRIIYHFGNSDHHDHMFDLLEVTSGIVVLHDFFLSGIVAHREWHGQVEASWSKELYRSHGYTGPLLRKTATSESEAVWQLPCSYSIVDNAHGVIVHSHNSIQLAKKWYGKVASEKFNLIPHLRLPQLDTMDRADARRELSLSDEQFVVCSFGMVGPTKLNHVLLDAWDKSYLSTLASCRLIFVGQNDSGPYGEELQAKIRKGRRKGSVSITGWADHPAFRKYLASADLAIQLRTLSRGETSGTVLDCLNYGVPLIVNANGSMSDLSPEAALILDDEFTVSDLTAALERLHADHQMRVRMGAAGRAIIRSDHAPRTCADLYRDSIERSYLCHEAANRFETKIAMLPLEISEKIQLSDAAARSLIREKKRIFVDISELAASDANTGIQRVVRNIVSELLAGGISEHRIEPVYIDQHCSRFRYARRFTMEFMDVNIGNIGDEITDFTSRDTLLLLDLNPNGMPKVRDYLDDLTDIGVNVVFVVYDLLPIKLPHCFPPEAEENHSRWLECVSRGSKAICISKSVSADLKHYLSETHPESKVEVSHFPLGSQLDSRRTRDISESETTAYLSIDFTKPTFLMVGTIEPRKGHADVLDAFEKLWQDNLDINLCIVGKQGWMVEKLINRINSLANRESRLKWLPQASDEVLRQIYHQATCLIGASLDEGFGLPLVEAAQFSLPLIARDIRVFREVCGGNATYFDNDLVDVLETWLNNRTAGMITGSSGIEIITWHDSAARLIEQC